jgi:hypothetical protein
MTIKRNGIYINMVFVLRLITAAVPLRGGVSPDIGGFQVFPEDNPWNWDISAYSVHPNSDNFVRSIGEDGHLHPDFGTVWEGSPIGIPYVVVRPDQPLIPVEYTAYGDESDTGPFPVPLDATIEGGPDSDGDRHVIAVDTANAMLYELYRGFPQSDHWEAESGAAFDLKSNAVRPEGWTSADAAGLPIFPGLVRYEEAVVRKRINHAIRFTVARTQRKFIWPARHFASSSTDPDLPPMGLRFRLKAGFGVSGFSEPVRVILVALKKYGMIVADNGSNWFLSGAPDDRWDDEVLAELKRVPGSAMEAVLTVDADGNPVFPPGVSKIESEPPRSGLEVAAFPNPFNSMAVFKCILPRPCHVRLTIHNVRGETVATVVDGHRPQGEFVARWIPGGLASGIYGYRLQTGGIAVTGKVLFQK